MTTPTRHGHLRTTGDDVNPELLEHDHIEGGAFHEHVEYFDHYPVCTIADHKHEGDTPLARYWCNVARVIACSPCSHDRVTEWPDLAASLGWTAPENESEYRAAIRAHPYKTRDELKRIGGGLADHLIDNHDCELEELDATQDHDGLHAFMHDIPLDDERHPDHEARSRVAYERRGGYGR